HPPPPTFPTRRSSDLAPPTFGRWNVRPQLGAVHPHVTCRCKECNRVAVRPAVLGHDRRRQPLRNTVSSGATNAVEVPCAVDSIRSEEHTSDSSHLGIS